jgi:hypothetical protein
MLAAISAARKKIGLKERHRKHTEPDIRQIEGARLIKDFPTAAEILKDVEIKLLMIDG